MRTRSSATVRSASSASCRCSKAARSRALARRTPAYRPSPATATVPISTVGRLSPVGPHARRCTTNAATTPTAAIAVSRQPSVTATVYSATSAGPSSSRTAGAATTPATTANRATSGCLWRNASAATATAVADATTSQRPAVLWIAAGITASCACDELSSTSTATIQSRPSASPGSTCIGPLMSQASGSASRSVHGPTIRADLPACLILPARTAASSG